MTADEADSIGAAIEALQAYADRQAELAKGVVALFIEMTEAMGPVLEACRDVAVSARAYEDLKRINDAVVKLAAKGGWLH